MGAAACAFLARRGARVLGLERFGIPHALGSSHGGSRVFRLCYYEHPDYVPLLRRALALWRELDSCRGGGILRLTGGLYMGPAGCAFIRGSLEAARRHDLPHEALDRGEIARRFPQFTIPPEHVGVFEPRAGILFPERIIAVYAEQALRDGAQVHGHERVVDWTAGDAGVEVRTERSVYTGRHIVLCAGAWTTGLLRAAAVPLVVSRQVAGWLWPQRPHRLALGRLPVWGIDDPEGFFSYGFPMLEDRPGIKVARHYLGPTVDAETLDRTVGPDDEARIQEIVRRYLPDAQGPVLSASVCMYTSTPDTHFVIDRHPASERVTIACGFSGHGFKFASVIGEVLADLALDGGTDHPIGFLRLARLGRQGSRR